MRSSALIRMSSVPARLSISSSGDLHRTRSFTFSPRSASPAESKPEAKICSDSLRRSRSDPDLVGSRRVLLRPSLPATLAEEAEEEVEYSGGGMGAGKRTSRGEGGDGDRSENERMAEYYKQMLSSDPENPLLLRNYGRFLHEVEGDATGAEDCYGRAVLASPEDGEVLAMYGKLVWEAHGDSDRAGDYLRRAVDAAPDDCYVLGSYAHFLWDAEEEEEEEKGGKVLENLVEAF